MGFCEQLFSAVFASPLRETASLFSRAITPLTRLLARVAEVARDQIRDSVANRVARETQSSYLIFLQTRRTLLQPAFAPK